MPIWMALPPEVSSSLLSDGPGPGSLLAAAQAWTSLSIEYDSAADELTALLADVQVGAWQGPSAEQYLAAHVPYLTWLMASATESAATAAAHEAAAAAYAGALAAMPPVAEIAANHAVHVALMGTNFLGVNTIPIAVNEADYLRMWVQAAETMTVYQSVSESALAATPTTTAAPQILAAGSEVTDPVTGAMSAAIVNRPPNLLDELENFLTNFQTELAKVIQNYWINNFVSPLSFDLFPNGFPVDAVTSAHGIAAVLTEAFPFLSPTLISTLAWATFHTSMVILGLAELGVQMATVGAIVAAGPAAAVAAAAGGTATALGVVAASVAHPVDLSMAPASLPVAAAPAIAAPSVSPTVPGGAQAGFSHAPASAPAAPSAPHAAGAPPGGGPGVGAGPTSTMYAVGIAKSQAESQIGARRSRSAQEAAPAEAVGEEAAAVAANRARDRRRKRSTMAERGYRYEHMDLEPEGNSDNGSGGATACGRGTDLLGQTGTTAKHVVPAGITTLSGDTLAGGVTRPMLPNTWRKDAE
jgi:PPE-repeat protein